MASSAAIRIGTSGFSYKEWVGSFYPAKTAGPKMLPFYAERFPTVEINYTFRAMPRPQMLEGWGDKTPPDFRFALKAPQRITHFARLVNVEAEVARFLDVASVLGPRIGPALFQLPPGFKCDVTLLRDFLGLLGRRARVAFEFRDSSWFNDAVFAELSSAQQALCINQSEKIASPIVRTADVVYLRLRNEEYDDSALERWAETISRFSSEGAECYVFFKHEVSAPVRAERLRAILGQTR